MDWTIAAIAAPVVASLGTLWFSNSHADKADERKAAIERERWEFEARERRFQERLAAAAELDALADEAYLSAAEWYRARPGVKYASSAEHPPPLTTALEGSYSRVQMLCTSSVIEAAKNMHGALLSTHLGMNKDFEYLDAQQVYREACQAMLAERANPTPAALPSKTVEPGKPSKT